MYCIVMYGLTAALCSILGQDKFPLGHESLSYLILSYFEDPLNPSLEEAELDNLREALSLTEIWQT